MGIFKSVVGKLRGGLTRTRETVGRVGQQLRGRRLDAEVLQQVERCLIEADVGVQTSVAIVADVRQAWQQGQVADGDAAWRYLREQLIARFPESDRQIHIANEGPTVILVAGVNGAGKTTSIAKIARSLREEGKSVLLGACDTFRAAAVEQLEIWSQRLDVQVVKGKQGGDPAAVAYDAADAAVARGVDVLLVDTAGRLHTQEHLMRQLEKIRNVVGKRIPGAPHEVMLVLDATTGQNAVNQARLFSEAIDVTGVFLAKLDGTAKGGIVIAIHEALGIPVKLVGVGETPDDVEPFDPRRFVEAMFE